MPDRPAVLKVAESRNYEDYIIQQLNYNYDVEQFRDWHSRNEDGDRLYRGDLAGLFPDETALPTVSLVENKYKNALHDVSRLASEAQGMVKFVAQGAKDEDRRQAEIRESINEGYWRINRVKNLERQFYLDLAGTGVMIACVYYNDESPYPQIHRKNPRLCYPDVRNGKLQTLVSAETVKERVLARQFPHLELDGAMENVKDVLFASYYDEEVVLEAVVLTEKDRPSRAFITNRWDHGLGTVPAGFEMISTSDGAFHGLFEQLSGPLMVRNKIVRFAADYLEQMAHAPLFEQDILNAEEVPGPDLVYRAAPGSDKAQLQRIGPAQMSGDLWRILQYMGDQEEKEGIQPPARSGNVSQSIASGSFVAQTQGMLTSVVKELQDKMSSFREQLNEVCMRVDEKFMNNAKPLYRAVGNRKQYTPSKDINGWYFHEVKFGAGAGLDRLNADTRVANHLALRLISREEARSEIDYLDDSASSDDKTSRENLQDVIFQRLVTDPRTPMSTLSQVWLAMKRDGMPLDKALEKYLPELQAKEQEAAGLEGTPGQLPTQATPAEGGEAVQAPPIPPPGLPRPPLSQLLIRS